MKFVIHLFSVAMVWNLKASSVLLFFHPETAISIFNFPKKNIYIFFWKIENGN